MTGTALKQPSSQALAIGIATAIVGALWGWPSFRLFFFEAPAPVVWAGFGIGAILYLPSLATLWFLDRREREPPLLFWGAMVSVIFYFGPIAAATNTATTAAGIPDLFTVGIVEELIKQMPLLVIALLFPGQINGARDGIVYGGMAGLGFAILEASVNFATDVYPHEGLGGMAHWFAGRATFLGTHLHILWSALIGAAVAHGLTGRTTGRRFGVPLGIFLLVTVTHALHDTIGTLIGPASIAAVVALFQDSASGILSAGDRTMIPLLIFGSTMNLLLMSIVVGPLLIRAIVASGRAEKDRLGV